jgi:hypothetical protein
VISLRWDDPCLTGTTTSTNRLPYDTSSTDALATSANVAVIVGNAASTLLPVLLATPPGWRSPTPWGVHDIVRGPRGHAAPAARLPWGTPPRGRAVRFQCINFRRTR